MKIKKGDKVKILTGKDKGKTGKVLQIFVKKNKLSVEGANLLYKNMRPKKQGEKTKEKQGGSVSARHSNRCHSRR